MKNWKKIDEEKMSKIQGGGFWLTVWALSLTTIIVGRSIMADKASIAVNGVGRASWENGNPQKTKLSVDNESSKSNKNSLEFFMQKFYEI